jgi:hypothetical protein
MGMSYTSEAFYHNSRTTLRILYMHIDTIRASIAPIVNSYATASSRWELNNLSRHLHSLRDESNVES